MAEPIISDPRRRDLRLAPLPAFNVDDPAVMQQRVQEGGGDHGNINRLLVLRTNRAHWDLVFQSAFEAQTFRVMAGDKVAGRHFSEPRHFGYTAFGIRITATGVKGTT